MIGLVVGSEDGYVSMVFYMFIYLFMNLGVFSCIIFFIFCIGSD